MILIGIDTGVNTGFARSKAGEFVELGNYRITDALEHVLELHNVALFANDTLIVCIEDVRKRKWVDSRIGRERLQGVGSVKRDCGIWQEFCEKHGIRHLLVAPASIQTKTTAKEFYQLTGWQYEATEHARDAAMMIDKYYRLFKSGRAELPPVIKPKKRRNQKPKLLEL